MKLVFQVAAKGLIQSVASSQHVYKYLYDIYINWREVWKTIRKNHPCLHERVRTKWCNLFCSSKLQNEDGYIDSSNHKAEKKSKLLYTRYPSTQLGLYLVLSPLSKTRLTPTRNEVAVKKNIFSAANIKKKIQCCKPNKKIRAAILPNYYWPKTGKALPKARKVLPNDRKSIVQMVEEVLFKGGKSIVQDQKSIAKDRKIYCPRQEKYWSKTGKLLSMAGKVSSKTSKLLSNGHFSNRDTMIYSYA